MHPSTGPFTAPSPSLLRSRSRCSCAPAASHIGIIPVQGSTSTAQSFGMETDQDNQKNTWVFLQAAEPLGPYESCAKGKAGSRHTSLVPAMLASSNLGTPKSRFCRPENGWEMDNLKGLRQPEGLVYGIPKKATYMAKINMINQKKKKNRAAHVQTNQQTTQENCPMRLGLQKIAAHNVQLPRQLGNHFGA